MRPVLASTLRWETTCVRHASWSWWTPSTNQWWPWLIHSLFTSITKEEKILAVLVSPMKHARHSTSARTTRRLFSQVPICCSKGPSNSTASFSCAASPKTIKMASCRMPSPPLATTGSMDCKRRTNTYTFSHRRTTTSARIRSWTWRGISATYSCIATRYS